MNKAEELKSYIPEYLLDSPVFKGVLNTIGAEFDRLKINIDELYAQCFIDTATWGLDLWDQFAGTQTKRFTVDERRRIIKSKLMVRAPATPNTLLNTLKNLVDDVEIIENYKNYSFDVILKTKGTLDNKVCYIMDQLELIKPAHMDYSISINYLTEIDIIESFGRWFSTPSKKCGTINVNNKPYTSTQGISYKQCLSMDMSHFFTDKMQVASENNVIKGIGVSNVKTLYISSRVVTVPQVFKTASETNYVKGGD